MEIGDLWKLGEKIWSELPMIRQVWKTMLIALVIVCVVVWLILDARYSDRLNSVRAQAEAVEKNNDFLESQLEAFRNKFPNKTPKDIEKEISSQKNRISTLEDEKIKLTERLKIVANLVLPRHLNDGQKYKLERLAEEYCPKIGGFELVVSGGDREAMDYSMDFLKSFKRAGCKVSRSIVYGSPIRSRSKEKEIKGVHVISANNPTPEGKQKVKSARQMILKLGLSPKIIVGAGKRLSEESNFFAIYIGPK